MYAAIGRHPNSATGFDDADLAELADLAAHERCVAIGETGLDYYRDGAPAEDQRRAFLAQIELARATGKPLVIHTRAADDETLELLDAHAGDLRVILHCFSMADRIEECLAHAGWWISFAGNATYPKSQDLRLAALRVPAERMLVETDAPVPHPQAVRGQRNQPAYVVHTAQAMALERRVSLSGVRPCDRGQRRRRLRVVRWPGERARASASWGRTSSSIRTSSGVIERLAEPAAGDVVLEIGGGLGVLSERLAPQVAHLHVVEVDPRLEPRLRATLAPFDQRQPALRSTRSRSTWARWPRRRTG